MYLITEKEDPPSNAPLSGPSHLLSKSLTKVFQSDELIPIDSMHNQVTIIIGEVCSFVS